MNKISQTIMGSLELADNLESLLKVVSDTDILDTEVVRYYSRTDFENDVNNAWKALGLKGKVKSHLLQSQIRLIEVVVESLKADAKIYKSAVDDENIGYLGAIEDQISSLNETLKELKKSL